YGIKLTVGQQALAGASCMIAGIGIAGVPEGGLISLSLVLATVGLPLEILPLLLTVDWLLSRCRAMTNVTSDILVAVLLDRLGAGAGGLMPEPPPNRGSEAQRPFPERDPFYVAPTDRESSSSPGDRTERSGQAQPVPDGLAQDDPGGI